MESRTVGNRLAHFEISNYLLDYPQNVIFSYPIKFGQSEIEYKIVITDHLKRSIDAEHYCFSVTGLKLK